MSKLLFDGEEQLHSVRQSWWNWARAMTLTCGLYAPVAWYKRKGRKYIVTSERVIVCQGVFGSTTDEINLDDVRQVKTEASWRGDAHDVGNILLYDTHSYNEDESDLELCGVPSYQEIANAIRQHRGETDE